MGKHKTIVVIEDDPSLQQDLTIAFVEAGLVVHNAYDGDEGARLVLEKKPDIVLLDLILPKKGGFEVLEEIKTDPRTEDIPVIVLSNLETSENVEYASRLGAVSYLVKPNYRTKDILTRVESVLLEREHA
jgi:two-component system, OmpR family, response regulator RpaA